ncbi:S8 family peptidase [Granulosicoccaceae sp. 1_MG-2023]|nr:S8 family peptidase [Granulosicoccaceae sp. 1_MG-2023]
MGKYPTAAGLRGFSSVFCQISLVSVISAASAPALSAGLSDNLQSLIISPAPAYKQLLAAGKAAPADLATRLSARSGQTLAFKRSMSGGNQVLSVPAGLSDAELEALLLSLAEDPSVAAVEPDSLIAPMAVPPDYYFPSQWNLHTPEEAAGGLNAPQAWNYTTGDNSTVVAVIDTGIRPEHIDLQDRVLPGYDFITEFALGNNYLLEEYPSYMTYFRTNDGDGRDDDPTDPGDWVDIDDSRAMMSMGTTCEPHESSFHGTAIAGIIAANSNNNHGIAGIDWQAQILPARVSGKCGGARSDMIDAIRWAAGIEDPTLPENPTPARVINLSLGSVNACGFAEQEAINEAREAGAVLVAAVGNEALNLDTTPTAPATCDNVIAVTAVRQDGGRAYYTNYGLAADIAAPGGEDTGGDGVSMVVDTNRGLTEPVDGSHFKYVAGTSVAAAHVSGVLSLMIAANPELTPAELEERLLASARDFPDNGVFSCDSQSCGAGIADAGAAVELAMDEDYASSLSPELGAAQTSQQDDQEQVRTGVSGGCSLNSRGTFDPTLWLLPLLLGALARRLRSRARP